MVQYYEKFHYDSKLFQANLDHMVFDLLSPTTILLFIVGSKFLETNLNHNNIAIFV